MSDRRLRELERRWKESGSPEDRKPYAKALKQAGQPKLPRLVIRHYIKPEDHGVCGPDGKIDRSLSADQHGYSYGGYPGRIEATCSVDPPLQLLQMALSGAVEDGPREAASREEGGRRQ